MDSRSSEKPGESEQEPLPVPESVSLEDEVLKTILEFEDGMEDNAFVLGRHGKGRGENEWANCNGGRGVESVVIISAAREELSHEARTALLIPAGDMAKRYIPLSIIIRNHLRIYDLRSGIFPKRPASGQLTLSSLSFPLKTTWRVQNRLGMDIDVRLSGGLEWRRTKSDGAYLRLHLADVKFRFDRFLPMMERKTGESVALVFTAQQLL